MTCPIYFDADPGSLARTAGIGQGKNKIDLNFKRCVPTGGTDGRLAGSAANDPTEVNVILALSGFGNPKGLAFSPIEYAAPTPHGSEEDAT